MADLKDLFKSKKVEAFVRKEKSRPWTVLSMEDKTSSDLSDSIQKKQTTKQDSKKSGKKNKEAAASEPVDYTTSYKVVPESQKIEHPIFGSPLKQILPIPTKKTEAKVEPKLKPNRSQSGAELESKWSHQKEKNEKVEPQPEPKLEPIQSQTEAKVEPKIDFSAIVGLQKKVLISIYKYCRYSGSKISSPIAIRNIADECETTISAVKKATQRLEEINFIQRKQFKNGRGGWTKYELPAPIYNALLYNESEAKVESKWSQTRAKVGTKVEPQPEPTAPSSSSNIDLNNKTTTTETGSDHVKSSELISQNSNWEKIDHESLKEIGFNASHVAQVVKQGLHTPQSLQDSIYAFKFDLNVNKRASQIQGSALNYFMGILRKGPYAPPQNYESPEDRQLREYLEAKEKLLESKRIKLNRIKEIEFEEWMETLSRAERDSLAPMGTSDHLKRTQLRNHFDEHIWELKKEKLVGDFESKTGSESSIFFENITVNRDELPPLTPP